MDKIYVPDPQKWVKYYQNMMTEKRHPYFYKRQKGGSLKGKSIQSVIPAGGLNEQTTKAPINDMKVELVSPTQQVIEQAKAEIKSPVINTLHTPFSARSVRAVGKKRRSTNKKQKKKNKSKSKRRVSIKNKNSDKKRRSKKPKPKVNYRDIFFKK